MVLVLAEDLSLAVGGSHNYTFFSFGFGSWRLAFVDRQGVEAVIGISLRNGPTLIPVGSVEVLAIGICPVCSGFYTMDFPATSESYELRVSFPAVPGNSGTLIYTLVVFRTTAPAAWPLGNTSSPFGGGSTAPVIAFLTAQPTGNPFEYKLGVGSVSKSEAISSYQVVVVNRTTVSPAVPLANLVTGIVGSGGGITLTFTDLNGDGRLAGGDFFLVQGVKVSNSYDVSLYWKATGSLIVTAIVP